MKSYCRFLLFVTIALLLINKVANAQIKIFVISDIHYFDPELLVNDGPAFQSWISLDRKLLKESEAILESLIQIIMDENPDILLVPGDLTKDGEKSSHNKVAQYFTQLEQTGIQVFVTPGNHDINNPHALSFDFDKIVPVETINRNEFFTIYNNFGYNEALDIDTASLSYVAEPIDGLWILSMDACKYDSNSYYNAPETSGAFKETTLNWITDKLKEAKNQNKQVIGIMHHNLVEHFQGQADILWQYIVSDWENVSSLFADAGLKIVFTGHTHAQDIVKKTSLLNNTIYDVETGSAITYPCPYRIVNLYDNGIIEIRSGRITEIDFNTKLKSFQKYAYDNILEGIHTNLPLLLSAPPFNLSSFTINFIKPALTESIIAHYEGNETSPSKNTRNIIDVMKIQEPEMGIIIDNIWNDPEPDDLNVTINLNGIATDFLNTPIKHDLKLYPNPAKEIINISLPGYTNDDKELQIYSIDGILKFSTILDNSAKTIDVSTLIPGIYYISIPGLNSITKLVIVK